MGAWSAGEGTLATGWGPAGGFGEAMKTQRPACAEASAGRREERGEEVVRSSRASWAIAVRLSGPAISTAALARWKEARSRYKLFQQFVTLDASR